MAKSLRKHQIEAVQYALSHTVGKILLPTGTGKGLIMSEYLHCLVNESAKSQVAGIHVVLSPRILLSWMHIKIIGNWLLKDKQKQVMFLNVNSGELHPKIKRRVEAIIAKLVKHGLYTSTAGYNPLETTTSPDVIRQKIEHARKHNYSLIICSTYNSAPMILATKCAIDSYHYDEAQYLVTNGEFAEVAKYPSNRKCFYTATPKHTKSNFGNGMNNVDIFGDTEFYRSPEEMIRAGEMVKPAIQLMDVRGNYNSDIDASDDYKAIWNSIADAFDVHKERIKTDSSDPDNCGAKLLVIAEGQKQLMALPETVEFKQWLQDHPHVGVFLIYSDNGAFMRSPSRVATHIKPPRAGPQGGGVPNWAKAQFLTEVSPPDDDDPDEISLKDADDAIMIHVKMLEVGIDVPGITAIMPFGNLGRIAFLQNLGRAARLHHLDRDQLYAGKLNPEDMLPGKCVKPYCWVILPNFVKNSEDFTGEYSEILRTLRTDYGFDSSEVVILGNGNAAPVDVDLDGDELPRQIRSLDHQVYDFFHELEDVDTEDKMLEICQRINTLTDDDKERFFSNDFKHITS